MRILLTDATGLLGPPLLERLLARGDIVRVLILRETPHDLQHRNDVEVIEGSLSDVDVLIKATKNVEVVYHLAQLSPAPERTGVDFVRVNVQGTENLLRACGPHIRRFVFRSAVSVYRPAPFPFMWPITENASLGAHGHDPLRYYGQTKIEAENLVRRFHRERGFEYIILRPTVVYGRGSRFVEQLLAEIISRPWLALSRGAEWGVMQWVHVSDMAEAVVLTGTQSEAANQVFNVAGNEAITVEKVIRTVWQIIAGRSQKWMQRFQNAAARSDGLKFDISKAQAMLGWTPHMTLREGLEEMLWEIINPQIAPPAWPSLSQEFNTEALWRTFSEENTTQQFQGYDPQRDRGMPPVRRPRHWEV